MMFGRNILIEIRQSMLVNEILVLIFEDCFLGKFSEATQETAFVHYLKVLINVRANYLCYIYNCNIYKVTKNKAVVNSLCNYWQMIEEDHKICETN